MLLVSLRDDIKLFIVATFFSFSDIPLELFKKDGAAYSSEMRQFCLTLSLYSRKGYDFVRRHLPLPHTRTIRK